jgi:hypothetical protein
MSDLGVTIEVRLVVVRVAVQSDTASPAPHKKGQTLIAKLPSELLA